MKDLRRQLGKNIVPFVAILGLMAIALVVGYYILQQQRLRIPLLEEAPYELVAEFESGHGVTPGQGQTVQVAGVTIGRIGSVAVRDGRARVGLDIFPEYDDLIRTNAKALLRPRTGLKDMYIQVFPGKAPAPVAKEGFAIPVANTAPDVDLHEILAELDERTQDYIKLLLEGTGTGLKGRGEDLAEVFRRLGPTFRDLKRVNRAVAQEREALKDVVSSLASINERLARDPEDLTQLVDASAATFGAFASEDQRLRQTISELPPTLRQATDTLQALRPFARELGPTTRALIPAFRELDEANEEVQPFAREATPIVRDQIRPFVRASVPLLRDLAPAAKDLSDLFPDLTRDLRVLNRFFNMLGFNPNGAEPVTKADREEGYLFWLAWVAHQGVYLQNVQDGNGIMRPVFLTGTCGTLTSLVFGEPVLEFGLNLSPILSTVCGDPDGPSTDPQEALQLLLDTLPSAQRERAERAVKGDLAALKEKTR